MIAEKVLSCLKNVFYSHFTRTGVNSFTNNCRPIRQFLEKPNLKKKSTFYYVLNAFKKQQFKFIKYRSTLTQLLTCFRLWDKFSDQERLIKLIYIDFEKVFDKIPRAKLIKIQKIFGVSESLLARLSNSFNHRNQHAHFNGTLFFKTDFLFSILEQCFRTIAL